MKITEENFVSQIKVGNEEGLNYILLKYGWVIKTVSHKYLSNLAWYEDDCMNDILLAVWENIERFNSESGSFKNWLAGVSKYTALNYLRKYQKEMLTEGMDETIQLSEAEEYCLEVEDVASQFYKLIACLKPKDQELFIQLFEEEKSLDEISESTGLTKAVLYNRVSRGKKRIRKNINS